VSVTATPVPSADGPRLLRGAPVRSLAQHVELWGPAPIPGPGLVAEVAAAGIGGRGGARFPLATKLSEVAQGVSGTVVVNATEGEPASAKDRTLLEANAHLVLDGAATAAVATRASEIVVCVDRASVAARAALEAALVERRQEGVDRVRIRVAATPSRYLAGQETALVRWLDGGDARPRAVPPRPSHRGVRGRPTLVSNAETLAHLALVARFGASWYAAGSGETTLVTVSGAVTMPGVDEVAVGTPVGDIVAAAGGDARLGNGILVGGYFGAWLPPSAAATPLADAALAPWGAAIGAGVIAVLDADVCALRESARILRWLADQRAEQCGPCIHGLPALAGALDAVVAGDNDGRAAADLARWAAMVDGRGACALPDGAARLVRSVLSVFGADIDAHRRRGPCGEHGPVLPTPTPGPWR
jgi:NADH:ubiquinone oxidoreductase subunit F (NADH-binding)